MTETLPRYWCGRRFYEGLKILVHAEKTLDSLFALPWLADFFSLLGLERKDFVVFERPTRIRMLIVAGSAFEENHFAHKAFARYCNELGEKHGEDIADGRPIYLSRAQYKSEMRQINGEPEVGAYLAREGFSIVAPETLQVRQQLRLFSEHRPTVGFVGSAFHNSIFCRRPVGVALTCDGLISSNFTLMDQANEARIQYVTAPEITLEKFVLGQPALYRLNDPVHTARVLVDLVYRRVWQNEKTHDAEGIDKEKTYLIRTYHQSWMQIDRQTGIVFHGNGEGERIVRLVAHLGDKGWAALTTLPGDCLTVERDNHQGTTIYYRFHKRPDGRVAFYNDETHRFLCATPDGKICCDRLESDDWECFTLEDA